MSDGVLLIYTGGTIGSMPKDPSDEASPQIVVDWDTFKKFTPELNLDKIGFNVDFVQTSDLLDSCNIGPSIWTEIAEIIFDNYDKYEGFVILHGTDTMVYTASALSFMLVNLSKPVILTGSQRTHLFQARNDGLQNMLTALTIANPRAANIPVIPEVMIQFGQDLLRGNRTRKRDANGFAAYESPKYPALAKVGANINVDETRIRPMPTQSFFIRKNLELNVIDFNVFPGIVEANIADKLLDGQGGFQPKGVVVRSYGAGNIPTDTKFLNRLETSAKRGVVIYNVTQCTQGRVELGLYETSNKLLSFGMVSGTDLTPEAALVKMMVGLGDEDLIDDPLGLRNFLQQDQAGEQSTTILEVPYPVKAGDLSVGQNRYRFSPDRDLPGDWGPKDIESVIIRLYDAQVFGGGEDGKETVNLEIYAGLTSSEPAHGPTSAKFACSARRAPTKDKTILSFDVTQATKRLFAPGQRASFSLVLDGEGSMNWSRAELALFIKE